MIETVIAREPWCVKHLKQSCQELIDAQALWESRRAAGHEQADRVLAMLDADLKTVACLLERSKQDHWKSPARVDLTPCVQDDGAAGNGHITFDSTFQQPPRSSMASPLPADDICDVIGCAAPAVFIRVQQQQINEEDKMCKECYEDRMRSRPELAEFYRELQRTTGADVCTL